MLQMGRIPLTEAEEKAVQVLIENHQVESFTRRNPENSGPLIVSVTGGASYEVDETGSVSEVTR